MIFVAKVSLNLSDLENVQGGLLYAFVNHDGFYVSNGHGDAVIISDDDYCDLYSSGIGPNQIVAYFILRYENKRIRAVGVYNDLAAFRKAVAYPRVKNRICDVDNFPVA